MTFPMFLCTICFWKIFIMHNIAQDIAFGFIKTQKRLCRLYQSSVLFWAVFGLVSFWSCSSTSNIVKIHLDLTCCMVTLNILQPSSFSVLAVFQMNEGKMSRFAQYSAWELPSERLLFPFSLFFIVMDLLIATVTKEKAALVV